MPSDHWLLVKVELGILTFSQPMDSVAVSAAVTAIRASGIRAQAVPAAAYWNARKSILHGTKITGAIPQLLLMQLGLAEDG